MLHNDNVNVNIPLNDKTMMIEIMKISIASFYVYVVFDSDFSAVLHFFFLERQT